MMSRPSSIGNTDVPAVVALGRNLFEGEIGYVHTLARVFNGNATDFAVSIKVQESVFIKASPED